MDIQIGDLARQAIDEALAMEALERPALVVQPSDPEECCRAGFDVLLVPSEEIPSEGYRLIGEQAGWPVYLYGELAPGGFARLVINLDRASGSLAAILLPT